MAVTKIHPIKLTLNRAIKYVTNPDKTDEYALVDTYACGLETAVLSFESTLNKARDHKNANKAFHLIQSFVPEETTPEQAHEIGMKLCENLLGGKYSFVIGTHVDKHHIHNHIVFCAVDNIEYKKYYDCKETYRQIRNISDKLCEEYGLDVITEQKQKDKIYQNSAKSYKEWQEEKKGTSWKKQLKDDIKATIKTSKTYDDFIQQMRDKGYLIKGEKLDGSEGKYISFLCPGQDPETGRWIRGKKTSGNRGLGEDFSRENIKQRIDERAKARAERISLLSSQKPKTNLIDTSSDKFKQSPGLMKWADKQNLQRMSAVYAEMQKLGLYSKADLAERIATLEQRAKDNTSELKNLDERMKGFAQIIQVVSQYNDNKKYFNAYQRSKDPERYLENRISEITLFQDAEKALKRNGIDPSKINVQALREEYSRMETRKAEISGQIRRDSSEQKKLDKYLTDLNTYATGEKHPGIGKNSQTL